MIYQGLFNIIDLYSKEIDLFYKVINTYFLDKLADFSKYNINEKDSLETKIDKIMNFTLSELVKLGLDEQEMNNKFFEKYLDVKEEEQGNLSDSLNIFEKLVSPIVFEIFLEVIVDYLVNSEECMEIMITFKDHNLLPIEFIMEMRNLKNLLESNPSKLANLRKYINIRENVIQKFAKNKSEIERLEDLKDPKEKLQLIYLIYRIIDFFHIQKKFDFSHIKQYLQNNLDEWLDTIPLVTLKNPDLYYCGIYLVDKLKVDVNYDKIREFLLNLYDENVDEFEAPVMEATDRVYYFFKSTKMSNLYLQMSHIRRIMEADEQYFEPQYLRTCESSQLVVILKLYHLLGLITKVDSKKVIAIEEEIKSRIGPEGIKQYYDGFVSSEATYYVLFCGYMQNSLKRLKEYDLLDHIVSRIYRNLELLDFSRHTNLDLVSELFYSCESLKLLNCIETKQMISHLAKFLFPQEVVDIVMRSKQIGRPDAKFRHLKVNRMTGETIY